MTDLLPPFMVKYLNEQDAKRILEVNDVLEKLTEDELNLVSEIAVMGYVRGTMAPKGERIPPSPHILTEVVMSAIHMPDLYPHIGKMSGRISKVEEE